LSQQRPATAAKNSRDGQCTSCTQREFKTHAKQPCSLR
jgi:hypothetical protein